MHNGMLEFGDEKMSKSVGNVSGLGEVLDAVGGEVLLVYFSSRPLPAADRVLARAAGGRHARGGADPRGRAARWSPASRPRTLAPHRDAFFDALADDFNTAQAMAALYGWIRAANQLEGDVGDAQLREMLGVLGPRDAARGRRGGAPPEAVELAERRAAARAERDWAEADRLRDELGAMGWEVRDGPAGPELVPAG